MYTILAKSVISSLSFLSRYAISRMGIKRFAIEVTGAVAVTEVVNLVGEHNDWVKENKASILTLTLLSSAGLGLLRGRAASLALFTRASCLFSKVSLQNSAKTIAAYAAQHVRSFSSSGCRIQFGLKDFLELWVDAQGILRYKHSGSLITSGLLAAGFGGAGVVVGKNDWESTVTQLSLVLADLESSKAKDELAHLLRTSDPVQLVAESSYLLNAFLAEHNNFPRELAASMLLKQLSDDEERIGTFLLDAFVDESGDDIFEINGSTFMLEKGFLVQCDPGAETQKTLSVLGQQVYSTLIAFYEVIDQDQGIDLLRIKDTNRVMSPPFVMGDAAMSIVWDNDAKTLQHAFTKADWFTSAKDGLTDVTEASFTEKWTSWVESIDFFSDDTPNDAFTVSKNNQTITSTQLGKELGK